MKRNTLFVLAMVFAFIGVVLAGTVFIAKYSNNIALLCGENATNSCSTVQNSPYSNLVDVKGSNGTEKLKIPVTLAGIVFYAILFVLIAVVYNKERRKIKVSNKLKYSLFGLGVLGVIFSTYFTLVQAFLIKAYCKYCLTSAANTILLLVLLYFITFEDRKKQHLANRKPRKS